MNIKLSAHANKAVQQYTIIKNIKIDYRLNSAQLFIRKYGTQARTRAHCMYTHAHTHTHTTHTHTHSLTHTHTLTHTHSVSSIMRWSRTFTIAKQSVFNRRSEQRSKNNSLSPVVLTSFFMIVMNDSKRFCTKNQLSQAL